MKKNIIFIILLAFSINLVYSNTIDEDDVKINLPRLEKELELSKKRQNGYLAANISGALLTAIGVTFILSDSFVKENEVEKNGALSYTGAGFVAIGGASCIVFSILYYSNEQKHQKLINSVNYYRNLEKILEEETVDR